MSHKSDEAQLKEERSRQLSEQMSQDLSRSHGRKSEQQSEVASSHHDEEQEGEEGQTDMSKYDKDKKHPIIGLIVFLCFQFVALLFMVVATPIEFFTIKDEWRDKLIPDDHSGKTMCITAWGIKSGCRSRGYYLRDYRRVFCNRVRLNFKIVEAFCLMTIGFMTFALIAGIMAVCHKTSKGATGGLGTFAMVLCIIPWGVCAGMYHQRPCCETTGWETSQRTTVCTGMNPAVTEPIPRFKEMGKYSAAFGLVVAAWCLQFIGIIFAFIPL